MRFLPAIILIGCANFFPNYAHASHHPTQAANEIIDEAAVPAYPEAAPVHVWHHRAERKVRHHNSRRTVSLPRPDKSRPRRQGGGAATIAHNQAPMRSQPEAAKPAPDALALAAGALVGLAEGFADGLATAMPVIVRQRPYHFEGTLTIGDASFDFGSGGYGRGSIPYGDWPIDDSEGDWGKRHHALGLNGDEIYDRQLGVAREGIEMHDAYNLASAGCVAVEHWDKARAKIIAMVNQFGHAFLHVWPGIAMVTPEKSIGRDIVVLTKREHFAEVVSRRHVERRYVHRWSHRHYASK